MCKWDKFPNAELQGQGSVVLFCCCHVMPKSPLHMCSCPHPMGTLLHEWLCLPHSEQLCNMSPGDMFWKFPFEVFLKQLCLFLCPLTIPRTQEKRGKRGGICHSRESRKNPSTLILKLWTRRQQDATQWSTLEGLRSLSSKQYRSVCLSLWVVTRQGSDILLIRYLHYDS